MISERFPLAPGSPLARFIVALIAMVLFATPLCAQRPAATSVKPPARRETTPRLPEPTFDTLLAADSYKLYGEIRNVGQLLGAGGAGEIVDPISKLAEPPKEFQSIVKFLKSNAEALADSRLLFATWPARRGLPNAFVAIEFPTAEEAAKFSPKLETLLPTILPPVPVVPEDTKADPNQPKRGAPQTVNETKPEVAAPNTATAKPPERLPFTISRSGSLVFISDQPFKFEKLHPAGSKSLFEDSSFRIARDRFSSESIFVFLNVALEDKRKPQTPPAKVITEAESEAERIREQEDKKAEAEAEAARKVVNEPTLPDPPPDPEPQTERRVAVLTAGAEPPAAPAPTEAQKAQAAASSQMGRLLDALGFGEPQWPEAVGLALALDNNEYVIRAILVDSPNAKRLPLPFVPQLISGPAYAAEAPSVLPDDTELFVSVSVDFSQTYGGMRQATEARLKAEPRSVPASDKEPPLDAFSEFEKKAGFKIKDDLLPALGNEIALAGSLSALQGAAPFGLQPPPSAKPSPETSDGKEDPDNKASNKLPILLVGVKDREAARKLMPRVLDGLGIGAANLIAQVERREDTEMVNYAGVFAYAFVGNFLVISEAPTVRRVIDAHLNHQTLSGNNAFRNSRRWQPKQILGEFYVSPALMEGYHEAVRKQAPTMDPAMRDLLMALTPSSEAITYALSNEGLGNQHELHLPKNLIITMVATISSATKNPPPEVNEMIASGTLLLIANAQSTYKETAGKGSYGTLDKLIEQKLVQRDMLEKYGYKIDVTVSGESFEAVATPLEYGKTGKRSFFVDQSGVVRGDDKGGGPATIADKPVQP